MYFSLRVCGGAGGIPLNECTEVNVDHFFRELSSMSCGRLNGRGVWGRMDTCTRTAESLFCLPEIQYTTKSLIQINK